MSKVIFLPLEPLHERYTQQMYKWVEASMHRLGIQSREVLGKPSSMYINHGQWLDTTATIQYKSSQVRNLAEMFERGQIDKGDTILLGDVWFPGIESIRFMSDLLLGKGSVKIAGWHYAGCFDPHDYLARNLGAWSKPWELSILNNVLDFVCVGSEYHKQLLTLGAGGAIASKILPLGLAWNPDDLAPYRTSEKEKIVIFPHRNAPEKQPEHFRMLAKHAMQHHPDWKFVISTSSKADIAESENVAVVKHESKESYYRLLAKCSIFYSSALQETFGYALHEAIALGLSVVAPYRASYKEMLQEDPRFLYDHKDVCGIKLFGERAADPIPVPYEYTERYKNSTDQFLTAIMGTK